MADRRAPQATPADEAGSGAGPRSPASDHRSPGADPPDPVLPGKGVVLVVVAFVLGALVLPAATRPPARRAATVEATLTPSGSAGSTSSASATPSSNGPGSSGGTASSSGAASSTGRAPTSSGSTSSASSTAPPAGPAPSSVHVLVANATTVNGLAASVAAGLSAKGYAVLTPVVALTTVPSTLLYPLDATGQAALAGLEQVLGVGASAVVTSQGGPPPVSSATGADVVVVAGPDEASRFPPGSSGG
jgi:hypothetical protein